MRCTFLCNQFYSKIVCLLHMFRTNLVVHHQEHNIIYCITQFCTIGTIVLYSTIDTKLCNTVRDIVLLMMND